MEKKRDGMFYMEFPFINDVIHRKVKHIFKSANLPVQIYSKNRNLRSMLQNKGCAGKMCTMKDCPLQNKLCDVKNCVYLMICNTCQSEYVGSTKRALHQRIKEHMTSPRSSVFQHYTDCRGSFQTKILTRDNNISRLRLKEGIFIKKLMPHINSKSEREEFLHLLF